MKEEHFKVFGIRHHGPGSAKSLKRALAAYAPDLLLIEGPTEANELISHAADPAMKPPVALLIYDKDSPRNAFFYPFTSFSPEWQALVFAGENNVPARFTDLPQANWLAVEYQDHAEEGKKYRAPRTDPILEIAKAAGFSDGEKWWEHTFEKRLGAEPDETFKAVKTLITALRREFPEDDPLTLKREAYMRKILRKAHKDGFSRIAVVCGAWHIPAFSDFPKVKDDNALLKGLPKTKTAATWIPWNYSRISKRSAYGAGVHSPAWYDMLWHYGEEADMHFISAAAKLLRKKDLQAPTSGIIETVKLSKALAAMRGMPVAGIPELLEAAQAALCRGENEPLQLIHEKLVIGDRMGAVPPDVPVVPLQAEFEKNLRKLRLKREEDPYELKLDLRKEKHLRKSVFLHRLQLIDIPFGYRKNVFGKRGSFHEHWVLLWKPDFEIRLIEANTWGNTLHTAAVMFSIHKAKTTENLPELSRLIDHILKAELPEAVSPVTDCLRERVAASHDVSHLIELSAPLADVLRYGNIRRTDAEMLRTVTEELLTRILVNLFPACLDLNEEAGAEMFEKLGLLQQAVSTYQNAVSDEQIQLKWEETLTHIGFHNDTFPMIAGKALRSLFDAEKLTNEDAEERMSFALSFEADPFYAAFWLEGFLDGSVQLLIYRPVLWQMLNRWLLSLEEKSFQSFLPLLRRTFSRFSEAERRQLGLKVKGKFESSREAERPALDSEILALTEKLPESLLGGF